MNTLKIARTWSLIAIEEGGRQYGGNVGYDDDLSQTYRYDAAVPNHRQLSQGDLIFIRGRQRLIGVARVVRISSSVMNKTRQRCPVCKGVNIKMRKSKVPAWRCKLGHEFDAPTPDIIPVVGYEAHYGETFIAAPEAVPVANIRAAALRPNDQLSIEELSLSKLEATLAKHFPETRELIARFLDEMVLGASEALDPPDDGLPLDSGSEFVSSMTDTREAVLRAIKIRRGQRTFRDGLIRMRGGQCQVTGCDVADILEAAHIDPYRNKSDNHLTNGLLLRSDIHTLFDLNLMAICPQDLLLRFHPKIIAAGYAAFEGQPLKTGKAGSPAHTPLLRRWEVFQKLLPVPEINVEP